MRWGTLVLLMSDGRVKALLWFVIAAIAVAIILIFVEINLRRQRDKEAARRAIESPIDKINKFLKRNITIKEKLDFLDKTAKRYFKDNYKLNLNSNYSELIRSFEKHKHKSESDFCKAMFEAYYSHETLSNEKIISLGKMLIDIEINKSEQIKSSANKTFIDEILSFFRAKNNSFTKKEEIKKDIIKINTNQKRNKILKANDSTMIKKSEIEKIPETKKQQQKLDVQHPQMKTLVSSQKKVIEQNKIVKIPNNKNAFLLNIANKIKSFFNKEIYNILSKRQKKSAEDEIEKIKIWVKEAIKKGYKKNDILSLLKNKNTDANTINQVLKNYESEDYTKENKDIFYTNNVKKSTNNLTQKSVGVAERIIMGEKKRLEGKTAL